MNQDIHLLLHNAGFITSSIVGIAMALYSFLNNPNRTANVTLALTMLAITTFCISHLFGVNVTDGLQSRNILMFNISIIYTSIFNLHCVLALLGKDKQKKSFLILMYAVAVLLTIFYLLWPDFFLHVSTAKMYFPNYYVPGEYHWIMRAIFNVLIPIYFLAELVTSYNEAKDEIERNRIWYFFFAATLGYVFGSIPILLVYDIHIDPAWGSLFILFLAIPYVYATIQYELMDIKIIAKKAFYYSISIFSVGGLIVFFDYFSDWLRGEYSFIPFWLSPLVSSVLIVFLTVIVWSQLRQSDILKSEFIHIAMHKFRTPLTRIKWASDEMQKENLSESVRSQLEHIISANAKLVELTNILVNVDKTEVTDNYNLEDKDISKLVLEVCDSLNNHSKYKNIKIIKNIENDIICSVNEDRIKFVIQVFIENAINYSPVGDSVFVNLKINDSEVIFSVKDNGIGVSKEENKLIFSKFYRGSGAQSKDTEGMGIGLFLSKKIIETHDGKIWMESDGEGKGSTFYFSLQARNK